MLRLAIALGSACVWAGCVPDTRTKPEPPDMAALVDAYAYPTRAFDVQTAIDIQALVEAKVRALIDLETLSQRLEDVIGSLAEDDGGSAVVATSNVELEGEGFARIERICSGHGQPAPPIDRAANGYLDLTAGYTENGIDPVIWGRAFDCLEQDEASALRIHGAIDLYVGENLTLDQLHQHPILFALSEFAFEVDGAAVVSGGFDFQVCRGSETPCVPGHIEVLLALPGGDTLVLFFDYESVAGGFRAANGVWTCDFTATECTDGAGGVVTIPDYQL